MNLTVVCVGKLKEKFYAEAVSEYQKRLSAFCKLTLLELPEEKLPQDPSRALIDAALKREAAAIRSKIPPGAAVVCLCVEGEERSSEELAALFRRWETEAPKGLCFVVGSSYGLDPDLKREARLRLSMSPMTFPHHLARVMLLEQIYRAFQINAGSPYHK